MWITSDVELPDEILEAHERGELVFFVGAGASVDEPSNLPLFGGLAEKLAELAKHSPPKGVELDFFIGQLEFLPGGFDAHQHTHTLISDPKSRFNSLHSAVVGLAALGGAFRVVTTNYDDHLASAAGAGSIEVPDTWYAPALPLGNDFTGLVHLHGSVRRPKDEMILSDRDFGRAYLTDAWAARFLLPMFDRFTVVFIGYSHDDVIMRYLALGLPSSAKSKGSNRFAFTDDPRNSKWEYLGIRPIEYPVKKNDHRALHEALTLWADRARMGLTDHQSRMQEIIKGGTTLPRPDHDYLVNRLQTIDGVKDFKLATRSLTDESKLDWLTWLETLPEFKSLFSSQDVPEATAILGSWFATTFIGSATLNGAALQTVQRLGQSMTTSLYREAGFCASDLIGKDAFAGERWQVFLATSIHGQSTPLKNDSFMPFLPDAMTPSIAMLRTMLQPFLKLEQRWFVRESAKRVIHPDAKVIWNTEEYKLTQYILRIVQETDAGDRPLRGVLEESMMAAYDLLDAYHGKRAQDPISSYRSAIEPHAQNEFREPLDAVIDGLREYGIKALSIIPDLPDQWWNLDRALMQRLALYLVAYDPKRSADDKLQWLLDRTGLYEYDLKHETYHLLSAAVGSASTSLKQRVLDLTADVPDYPEDDLDRNLLQAYVRYNLLAWLTQTDPEWPEAKAAFDAIQVENPDFKVREHPDLNAWMTSATWVENPPMSIEKFSQALTQDAQAALDELLSHDYSEQRIDRLDWRDALKLVRQTVERSPELGLRLWDAVHHHDDLDTRQVDLWCTIVKGWGEAQLGDLELEVVERLPALLDTEAAAYAIGSFLLNQIGRNLDAEESLFLSSMRDIARKLWCKQGADFEHRSKAPLSSPPLYLNSWPGFLAQYWSREIQRRWQHLGEGWVGLSGEESDALFALLNGKEDALDATQPAITGDLFFYFDADPTFSEEHILPLFNDPQRHAYAWAPYLHHPRCNDRLLKAGLFECMVDEISRLSELPDQRLRRVFFDLAISVVTYAGIANSDRKRLLDKTVIASDGSWTEEFAEAVVQFLRKDGTDGAEVWRKWLREHLESRLNGLPRCASADELARWADVVPFVGEHVPDAVGLLSERGIRLSEQFINRNFPDGLLTSYGPEIVAFYAERVGNTTATEYMKWRRVQRLVQAIHGAVGDVVAQPLLEAARKNGFLDTRN